MTHNERDFYNYVGFIFYHFPRQQRGLQCALWWRFFMLAHFASFHYEYHVLVVLLSSLSRVYLSLLLQCAHPTAENGIPGPRVMQRHAE